MWHRVGQWAHREPLSAVAIVLIAGHIGIAGLYLTGLGVSTVPFTDATAQDVANSDMVWAAQLLSAILLAVAVMNPKLRTLAAFLSTFTWASYAMLLFIAARFRQPPLAPIGTVLAVALTGIAFVLLVQWHGRDEAQ